MICKKRFPEQVFNAHQCSGAKSYKCDIGWGNVGKKNLKLIYYMKT